jgi:signal transduction histidine kinase
VSSRRSILLFALVALAVLGTLTWVTAHTLRLEEQERAASDEARYQERLRLVLWRMDAALTPIIAREAARPYFEYRPFYPIETRVSRPTGSKPVTQRAMVASPLLNPEERHVRLYFEIDAAGHRTSPQWPEGPAMDLAKGTYVTDYGLATARERLATLAALLASPRDARVTPGAAVDAAGGAETMSPQASQSLEEYNARRLAAESAAKRAEPAADRRASKPGAAEKVYGSVTPDATAAALSGAAQVTEELGAVSGERVTQGQFTPRWVSRPEAGPHAEPELLLLREVEVGADRFTQGLWLDWPSIREMLLATSRGLFPSIELRPVTEVASVRDDASVLGRTLAAIPVEIVASMPPSPAAAWTPARFALVLMWIAVLIALAAGGVSLHAAADLARRRGQFVSAVTHELRTPLTTFCLYSQMLADGLVSEESQRQGYFRTLRDESLRLAKIVESVLDYARLHQRGARPVAREVGVDDVLRSFSESLAARCRQSDMELVIEDASAPGRRLRTDPVLIERIIGNLVENACKYASSSDDRRIHLSVDETPAGLRFRVRDHGPGIPPAERLRIFNPFVRGDSHKSGSVPGLGLGLAISRSLAGELGGELRLVPGEEGACFELIVPAPR